MGCSVQGPVQRALKKGRSSAGTLEPREVLATLPGLMMGCDLYKVGETLTNLTNADWNGNQIPKVQSRSDGK